MEGTASFDHTCRVWDLRQPLRRDHPVKTLHTGGCNVMCNFSPDDSHLLCSGVDTRITQFEVPSWRQGPNGFPLREPTHQDRYRRSIYMETGRHFVTAATEEAHMHIMSIGGECLGVVDFHKCGQYWKDGVLQVKSKMNPLGMVPMSRAMAPQGPGDAIVASHEVAAHELLGSDAGASRSQRMAGCAFIQSVRTHPTQQNRLGVLLCPAQGDQSCIALVDLDPKCLRAAR